MWKDVPFDEWSSYYEINENGEVRNKATKKLIKGDKNSAGYCRVTFYNGNKHKRFFRHRLVAMTFLPNPNNLKEVNHIDEDKNNNNVNNLEWVSRVENERKNHYSKSKKFTPFIVKFDNGIVKRYDFTVDLAKEINVTKRTIINYLQHKSRGYLEKGIKQLEYI